MKFNDLFGEKGYKLERVAKKNYGRAILYSIPLLFFLLTYDVYFHSSPIFFAISLFLVVILHFYSVWYAKESKYKILNYAPIWSLGSIISIVLIFITNVLGFGETTVKVIVTLWVFGLWFYSIGIADKILEENK